MGHRVRVRVRVRFRVRVGVTVRVGVRVAVNGRHLQLHFLFRYSPVLSRACLGPAKNNKQKKTIN